MVYKKKHCSIHQIQSPLLDLPSEIFVSIFEYLSIDALSRISRTCRIMHTLTMKFGWAAYLRLHPRPSRSLSCIDSIWTPLERVRYDVRAEKSWSKHEFIARPLSSPWPGKLLPVLAISNSRLVVAAGSTLQVYAFLSLHINSDLDTTSPGMRSEASYVLRRTGAKADARQDITGIVFIPDGGADRTLCAGFADGSVMRVTLPNKPSRDVDGVPTTVPTLEELYTSDDVIEGLAASGDLTLSLSGTGTAHLLNASSSSPSSGPSTIQLPGRSWSTHLCTAASTPYAAFGTSSATPLAIHALVESQLTSVPYAILGSVNDTPTSSGRPRPSAVYGICEPPPSFHIAPTQTLVAGWYDGFVRVYDLRSSKRLANNTRAPVISLFDKWSFEPIYAVSAGGSAGSHIAAGSARHSVVAFWDVRYPRAGWSVHAPGNDSSPVYSVTLESSRLFGATQSRSFVYDFGSGVTTETYPPVPRANSSDSLKKLQDGIGYYVTVYQHSKRYIA